MWIGLGMALAIGGLATGRRAELPRLTRVLIVCGAVLLALAAGGLSWRRSGAGEVLVMVDVSPSTRTATYRDRAALDRRVRELLGSAALHHTLLFAQDIHPDPGGGARLDDIAADHTVFAPPPTAGAVLLFSDGRFELPAVTPPRTFVVIDPGLDEVNDAAVGRLEIRGIQVAADVTVSGPPRTLTIGGVTTRPSGQMTVAAPLDPAATAATAQFSGEQDPWPENDRLTLRIPPKEQAQRWWVGNRPAPAGWRAFTPQSLPGDAAEYLAPSIIVLDNIPASSLTTAPLLQQYVRDLGGALVILGGDHAFAAGDYTASPLEALSPLASHPPRPAMQWIVLVDGSGSMAQPAEGATLTRWRAATAGVAQFLPHLPSDDLATLGSFADAITWWTSATKSVRETIALPLPPADVSPRGPTNLQRALSDVAQSATSQMQRQLIVITDAEAQIANASQITEAMKSARISLHVLAIGPETASGLTALRQIAAATGGSVRVAGDTRSWGPSLLDLGRAALPDLLDRSPLSVQFLSPLSLPPRTISPWNRTWLKATATVLAKARITANEKACPVARWQVGSGSVIAAAFAATPAEAAALADLVAKPPRDPRYRVTWDAGPKLHVTVDAIDGTTYLNDQVLVLELADADSPATTLHRQPVPQTAPGRYELSAPAPRSPAFAAVRLGSRILDRIALAGRYAPEFDAIGNDHDALRELARRSGGEAIDARRTKAIDFHWPRRDLPLTTWLAAAAALMIAAGLWWWRIA
jgi:hypothetical protein